MCCCGARLKGGPSGGHDALSSWTTQCIWDTVLKNRAGGLTNFLEIPRIPTLQIPRKFLRFMHVKKNGPAEALNRQLKHLRREIQKGEVVIVLWCTILARKATVSKIRLLCPLRYYHEKWVCAFKTSTKLSVGPWTHGVHSGPIRASSNHQ